MNIFSKYDWITQFNYANIFWRDIWKKYTYERKKRFFESKIKRIDRKNIEHNLSEIRLFAIMRNESLRLPHFLKYYKDLGVNRIFIVDNSSTDSSVDIASSFEDVHVFNTDEAYENHWYWMEYMLNKYGKGHWCLVVDIDELLSFPNAEELSIRDVCQFLDNTGSTALRSLLLDMYSNETVKNTIYTSGQNPLNYVPYFDLDYYEVEFPYFDRSRWESFTSIHFTGGMRERVFGRSIPVTSLNKFSLFKFLSGTYLGQGMHAINRAKVSDLQGVVFHTKFLSDFIQEAKEESIREQHFNKASYYKDFKKKFDYNPDLCLSDSNSILFQDSIQLVRLGLMKTNEQFEKFTQTKIREKSTSIL